MVSVSGLSATGFFAPLMIVQDKRCKCRFAGKAGPAWVSLETGDAGTDLTAGCRVSQR